MTKNDEADLLRTDGIAILLATYQGEKYIEEQLQSIVAQTNNNWKVFVHDDGSKDCTLDIVEDYANKYPNKFVIIEGKAQGCARDNFFFLMDHVDAPYYMCCDQDDFWLPQKIQISFEKIKKMEDENGKEIPCLIFTELTVVDKELAVIAERMCEVQQLDCEAIRTADLLVQNKITGCTMMMNRKLVELARRKNNVNNIIMHDWWCALIAAEFGKLEYVPTCTILYRQHETNSVGAKSVGNLSYIFKKLFCANSIKESIKLTRIQAKEFSDSFTLSDTHLISIYGHLDDIGKAKRRRFYKKYGIRKCGMVRNIGFKIFG